MPLSAPQSRKLRHDRTLHMCGYERDDGLWDIEGQLLDVRGYVFENASRGRIEPGEPDHAMWMRLTVDETLVIQDVEACIDHGPYEACPNITPAFGALKGERIGRGWHHRVREVMGGAKGCVHLVEMLSPMATVAFKTIGGRRVRSAQDEADAITRKRPAQIDTCHVHAADGEEVKKRWPEFYTGK